MDVWLKPFVYTLAAFGILPFALTLFLFCSARYESEKARLKKVLLPGILLAFLGNLACGYSFSALLFHTRKPWNPLKQILRLQCSWQDVSSLALLVLLCAAAALIGGWILRRLLLGHFRSSLSAGRKGLTLLLCVLCCSIVLLAVGTASQQTGRVFLSEICRKATVYAIDPEKKEDLGPSDRDISYVTLSNPGSLDCFFPVLFLSESEGDLTALSFRDITVPARGTCRLTMDYEHGLDLKKAGGSTVYLSSASGMLIDSVKVPALNKNEAWRHAAKTSVGEVIVYAERTVSSLPVPVFSRESGFYSEAFDLSLSAPEGMTIHYTLDGSSPSLSSPCYTEPLHIEDPSPLPNVWSAREDVSAALLRGGKRYTVPDEPVDKCAVVRAVCTDTAGNLSRVVTCNYFIGYENRTGYDSIGIISIVTDPENLFGDEGIYVLGKTFREQHPSDPPDMNWWWWAANYHEKGRLWERESSVQFFTPDRTMLLTKQIGLRIKGGVSAALLPKGLNLYARNMYDGEARFTADLFGTGFVAKRIALSAGGNDVMLKLKDWFTARLAGNLGVPMYRFIPYALFLDGEYWGNYWLTEQYDSLYFAHRYHLNDDSVIVIKNGSLKSGLPDDQSLFDQLESFFISHDLSVPKNYDKACTLIDPDNFALFYALEMYSGNEDLGLKKNTLLWRTRHPAEDVAEGDGRWHFALFDVNHGTCFSDSSADTLSDMKMHDPVFSSLMDSPAFRSALLEKLTYLTEQVFTPDRAEEAISEYLRLMSAPMELEYKRFHKNGTPMSGLDNIRAFIRERPAWLDSLKKSLGTE